MKPSIDQQGLILKELGDGLLMRRASPADAGPLSAFNASIHNDSQDRQVDEAVGAWTRDLLEKPHPTFAPQDFTIVEDRRSGQIVSSLNLINQTWSYAGVTFGVGRPELVGTHPDYRKRGLVRAQFDVIHQWSAERGHLMQAITGIPYYYRTFGYEMALALGGGRSGYLSHVPKLEAGQEEPFRIRPARESDLAFIARLYNLGCQRSLVSCVWNEALWRYELNGKSPQNVNRFELRVVENSQGEPLGFLAYPFRNWDAELPAIAYELKPGISWTAVTPGVARYLFATGKQQAEREGRGAEFESFGFWLGRAHPAYEALQDRLPTVRKPYAWYVRLPDLARFLERIKPVLEERLASSIMVGHSGEIRLSFYTRGLRLVFENGRLIGINDWTPAPQGHSGEAAFPGLTFLQLLFGYRSFEELRYAFPDCFYARGEVFTLLNILFPKQDSDIWPVA